MPNVNRHYLPASFSLYEFDDTGWAGPAGPAGQRRFSHWDGPVGQPAEEVTLSWAADQATVLVCTSGRTYDDEYARYRAAHLALGGTTLPIPNRPDTAADIARELERFRDAPESWREAPAGLPGGSPLHTAVSAGFAVGYSLLASGAVFIAAVGVEPDQFRLREVRDWDAYDVDARTRFE
jgi:hypothetical protein